METNDVRSPHILTTSSNLLGLCFIVITSIKVFHLQAETIIDEVCSVAIILFMLSSILSFLSMRSKEKPGARMENIADYLFLGGLVLIFGVTMLIAFNLVR